MPSSDCRQIHLVSVCSTDGLHNVAMPVITHSSSFSSYVLNMCENFLSAANGIVKKFHAKAPFPEAVGVAIDYVTAHNCSFYDTFRKRIDFYGIYSFR